jgi:hypothetical protein
LTFKKGLKSTLTHYKVIGLSFQEYCFFVENIKISQAAIPEKNAILSVTTA